MRTITVYNSSTQKKTVLENVEVSTLGELKRLFDANHIDYNNMDFMEGVSQTKLVNDNSILPSNIPYKGSVTNNLLIYLTLKDKKVRSGVDFTALDRRSLLAYIKENGLCEEVNNHFKQNYTRVSSADLVEFLKSKNSSVAKKEEPAAAENPAAEPNSIECVKDAIRILVNELYDEDYISEETKYNVLNLLDNPSGKAGESQEDNDGGFSMEEIHAMID